MLLFLAPFTVDALRARAHTYYGLFREAAWRLTFIIILIVISLMIDMNMKFLQELRVNECRIKY